MILNACAGKPLPVYGDGKMFATGSMWRITAAPFAPCLQKAAPEKPTTSADAAKKRIWILSAPSARLLDELRPNDPVVPTENLVTFVKDRPGHDRRYAMDTRKIERELNWHPLETFESGIQKTVRWYLEHEDWVRDVTSGSLSTVDGKELRYRALNRKIEIDDMTKSKQTTKASFSPEAPAPGSIPSLTRLPRACCRCMTSRWCITRSPR